ncbi:hypothetical protein OHB26_36575 [Nocardia sp. NBC_01503]|uniref:DoxX family protein n=1 Tax=Nocardia sp. NBC_01503 TaxID=2975997 RepID=UPI002E7BA33E|nr:hypothetical protein [Nocardia sp. NBC_01503]WTL32321.1 hypothetical protein OHB26_36575 [Nocardia sp. NBC_01503]
MFETLLLLLVPTLLFRLLGALGATRFATWRVAAAHGLAFMLLLTGASHFAPESVTFMPTHSDSLHMLPSWIPFPDFTIYLTGALEWLGALGLIITATRMWAGTALALLFVVMLPANIYAALNNIEFDGAAPTPLWFRVPEQLVYIGVALFAAFGSVAVRRTLIRPRVGSPSPQL